MGNRNESNATVSPQRVMAVDAYRGLVMFLIMAEAMHLSGVARNFPSNRIWQIIGFNTDHVAWTGCSLHDLIQPSFSFLVGVSMPFSIASRMGRGQSMGRLFFHAVWRAVLLVALGIFLRSTHSKITNFTFEDTLSQIGLGYIFLFLLGFTSLRVQLIALAVILAGYWAAFVWYPAPGEGFDFASVGVPRDWPYHFTGLAAHFDKNSNLAWAFDKWYLNLFPREKPFLFNGGGYATLSFIPTLGTMILGLIAGGWLQGAWSPWSKLFKFLAAGAVCLTAGWLLDHFGICPSVKRIWTPSWTLFSGGWCFFLLAAFYLIMEAIRLRIWAFPLVVIGMNSIAIYCLVHFLTGFIKDSFRIHLGQHIFESFGTVYEPVVSGATVIVVYWLILFWMYRRRLFLKI